MLLCQLYGTSYLFVKKTLTGQDILDVPGVTSFGADLQKRAASWFTLPLVAERVAEGSLR